MEKKADDWGKVICPDCEGTATADKEFRTEVMNLCLDCGKTWKKKKPPCAGRRRIGR